jgi:deoxyadenosine/deoxycytidine kinase
MPRWGFHSQLLYFTQGLTEHREILSHQLGAIQDRSIYEHFHVFAREFHKQGIVDADEFATLEALYLSVEDLLDAPDLLVYLDAPVEVLLERINHRGRGMESAITPEYLQNLEHQYKRFLATWTHAPVLFLDTAETNMLDNTELDGVCEQILAQLPA